MIEANQTAKNNAEKVRKISSSDSLPLFHLIFVAHNAEKKSN